MKKPSNNPAGRPPKNDERRKAVSYRLTPSVINRIKQLAEAHGHSQSDEVIAMVEKTEQP